MDKNEHVYCTNCVYGESLLNQMLSSNPDSMPDSCQSCFPFDPEDSALFEKRPNYVLK